MKSFLSLSTVVVAGAASRAAAFVGPITTASSPRTGSSSFSATSSKYVDAPPSIAEAQTTDAAAEAQTTDAAAAFEATLVDVLPLPSFTEEAQTVAAAADFAATLVDVLPPPAIVMAGPLPNVVMAGTTVAAGEERIPTREEWAELHPYVDDDSDWSKIAFVSWVGVQTCLAVNWNLDACGALSHALIPPSDSAMILTPALYAIFLPSSLYVGAWWADFTIGVNHWVFDNWNFGRDETFITRYIAHQFQRHHDDPRELVRDTKNWWSPIGNLENAAVTLVWFLLWPIATRFVGMGVLAPDEGSAHLLALQVLLAVFMNTSLVALLSNGLCHGASHNRRGIDTLPAGHPDLERIPKMPQWIMWMQDHGLSLSPDLHSAHHTHPETGEVRGNFSVSTGLANDALNAVHRTVLMPIADRAPLYFHQERGFYEDWTAEDKQAIFDGEMVAPKVPSIFAEGVEVNSSLKP